MSNILSREPGDLEWDEADIKGSLKRVFLYVLEEAKRTEAWYWERKRWKSFWSQILRFTAIASAALGGILPIVLRLGLFPGWHQFLSARGVIKEIDTGLWSSCFIALAASLVGLDRFFGLSSGWARYVTTGTAIRRASEVFRMDWLALEAEQTPSLARRAILIARASAFRLQIEELVRRETEDWVNEFQNSIAQAERDLNLHLEKPRQPAPASDGSGNDPLPDPRAPRAQPGPQAHEARESAAAAAALGGHAPEGH